MNEEEAIRICQSGQNAGHVAFRFVYDLHRAAVYRFVRRLVGDRHTAEDVVQETFIRLHRGLSDFQPSRPLLPFLLRIARNAAVDVLRRKKKVVPLIAADGAGDAQTTPDAAYRSELQAKVCAALECLAPDHRAVIVLRHIEGKKLREIGEILSCTERTTRNRLRSAGVLFERELRKRGVVSGELLS